MTHRATCFRRMCAARVLIAGGSCCLGLILGPSVAVAQRGDHEPAEAQRSPWYPIPPSPALTPDEALETFQLRPGFRIELIASEPLVEDPVAIAFDADGRIWAVEMRGWMNDVDGAGNDQPIGRVVTLEDTDGDGRMDRSTVFLDGLIMPRAVQVAGDGVLIAEPPHLWFCRDTDGDGRADQKISVAADYMSFATPQTNPEGDSNAPLWNIDNWLYSVRFGARFRYRAGQWDRQDSAIAGQWGLSQDDYGRHFFNTNADHLRANPLPAYYGARNPNLYRPTGWNAQVATDQRVWPVRVSPASNRGYQPGVLHENGRLATFTAACGPTIYRGGLFPEEFAGNAFVADPVGNLVKRTLVREHQGILSGESGYIGHEFLASTDERFRPVNLHTGPDGALYIVDMYRGIIEYVHVMTTYLRRQILSRNLDRPLGLGRIYRVIPENSGKLVIPKMSHLSSRELVTSLGDSNGWRRETAQRLLVERADREVCAELQTLARSAPAAVTRLHALWTLEGIDALGERSVSAALADPSAQVRAAAVRLSEPWLRQAWDSTVSYRVLARMSDPADEVAMQLALSLGEVKTPAAEQAMIEMLLRPGRQPDLPAHPYLADAVVSGMYSRELEFLEQLFAHRKFLARPAGFEATAAALASAIVREGKQERVERLLWFVSDGSAQPSWARLALLRGIKRVPRRELERRPASLDAWANIKDQDVREIAMNLAKSINWSGRTGASPATSALSAADRKRVETGRQEFLVCATCHQPAGQGMIGLAPPLSESRWLSGPPEVLARIVLRGKKEYPDYPEMPSFSNLDDERIASILSYIRNEWGHAAGVVSAELIAKVRQETRDQVGPVTKEYLQRFHKP